MISAGGQSPALGVIPPTVAGHARDLPNIRTLLESSLAQLLAQVDIQSVEGFLTKALARQTAQPVQQVAFPPVP